MFELIARLVSFFYSMTSSYGLAILGLTVIVMLVMMPLTFKSTRSMIEMRRIQPKIKKLQTKYADDRERMNKELMELYQKHGVNPVGGCLPMLVQAPVFFVLFRVVRGLTRRLSDVGFSAGDVLTQGGLLESDTVTEIEAVSHKPELGKFNPEFISPTSDMYVDLTNSNEMVSWGVDLSRSAQDVLGESLTASFPYLIMVLLTGVLSWYQQRQIQGRTSAEIDPRMQLVTKVIPFMAPIFAFTLPAALGVYFIGSALFRVIQNWIITNRFYKDGDPTPIEDDDDHDDDDDEPGGTPSGAAPSSPLSGLLGGAKTAAAPTNRHGSRSPVSSTSSARKRNRPPSEVAKPVSTASGSGRKGGRQASSSQASNGAAADTATEGGGSLWSRAKRSAATSAEEQRSSGSNRGGSSRRGGSSTAKATPKNTSKRVTPKGTQGRGKK